MNIERPTSPRLAPLSEDQLDEDTMKVVGPLGPLNIFRTLARHPKALKRWLVFGAHVLAKNTLPAREREILILRAGWRSNCTYEFGQHTIIGKQCGLTNDEIARLTHDSLDDWNAGDRALVQAADELHADQCLSDETWGALNKTWSEQQIIDVIFTVGQYVLTSMALNSLGVQREEGVPGFPDLAD